MSEKAVCGVCPHACAIAPGAAGLCGARGNEGGEVVSLNYGLATALALDPIEKKPLARFRPGSLVLSYGSFGCNMRCAFCQNSDISTACWHSSAEALSRYGRETMRQVPQGFVGARFVRARRDGAALRTTYISPEHLVEEAAGLVSRGNIGIALTYNEPLICPEYICDVGAAMHDAGLCCVIVTNGYADPGVFAGLLPFIDAANIDLKCFTEEGYRIVGAPDGLAVVKTNIEQAVRAGIHTEVTTLVVPGLSDDRGGLERECEWLASVSPDIPLHITRFFPQHKMTDASPTDLCLLTDFAEIARNHLNHVYLGNV